MVNLQPSTPWRYSTPAIVLHWVLAALIVFMACLGWYMMTVEREPSGPGLFALHRSIGLIVFTLVLLRVLWRVFHKPEPLPAGVPRWQVHLSHIVQWLLYVGMLALPITGIVGSSYSKAGIAFFGHDLPRWVEANRENAHQYFGWHETLVWIMVGLVVLHVVGGLKHLLVDRDQVFSRMWPGRR